MRRSHRFAWVALAVVWVVIAVVVQGRILKGEFDRGFKAGHAEGMADADSATVPLLRSSLRLNRELIEELARTKGLPAPDWDEDGWRRLGGGR